MTTVDEVGLNELEEIKTRLDIVEYIGKYVPLKQSGRNFKGLCPFHNEKTGSFMVSPDKQIFHCFGCGKGGDILTFAMEIEGIDFPTALKELADKAGVKLPERGNYHKEPTDKLYEINNETSRLYERELHSPANKKVLKYLLDRGMTTETIRTFRIGYSPVSGDIAAKELTQLGYQKEDLLKAAVCKERNGKLLDLFFNRITFPIMNPSGKVVGFTARVLDDSLPKYINTPETAIYHKSQILFNFDKAKEQIRKQDHVIVVEGQMDAIFSYQAGVKNVVASSGTALTEIQLDLIKRFTKNIKMSFDEDTAGQNATKRAIELAWQRDFNIKVITVPEGKDPADLIKADPKKWVQACRKAKYVVDYIFDSTFAKYNITNILDKKQATRELLAWIKKLPDPVEREHYLKLLGDKVGVSAQALADALTKIKETAPKVQTATEKVSASEKSNLITLERHALSMLLLSPKYCEFFFGKLTADDFTDDMVRGYIESIAKYTSSGEEFDVKKWQKTLTSTENNDIDTLVLATEEEFAGADEEALSEEVFYAVIRLKRESLEKAKVSIRQELEAAERSGDKKLQTELMNKFQEVVEEERKI